jgi:hypothetical protein
MTETSAEEAPGCISSSPSRSASGAETLDAGRDTPLRRAVVIRSTAIA